MIHEIVKQFVPKLRDIFEHLHQEPEISWEEEKTTAYLKDLLLDKKCKVTTFDDSTGLVVDIGNKKPVIALRADIDALWQEVNGTFQANHSCGHDAHMTIALGVIYTLLEMKELPDVTFRFIFQPAEEKGTGALSFVDRGVVDEVDFLYGMHLRPIEELPDGKFAPAIGHGAAKFIKINVDGEDAHGARPHLNANAIQVGMEFYQALNNIQINPMTPHSVKMTTFHAGGKNANIIPGSGHFSIDVRAQTNEVMQELTEKIEKIASTLAEFHQIKMTLSVGANVAAAVLNEEAMGYMSEAIKETVGKENLTPMITTTGGDDFHFYTIKRAELKATMLAVGCDLKPGLHHPNMTFHFGAIPKATEVLAKVMLRTADSSSKKE